MKYLALALPVALAACVGMEPTAGVVSGYNGNTVSIQTPGMGAMRPLPITQALAEETCGGQARYASTRPVSRYDVEFLFICG